MILKLKTAILGGVLFAFLAPDFAAAAIPAPDDSVREESNQDMARRGRRHRNRAQPEAAPAPAAQPAGALFREGAPSKGPDDAPVTIVIYSDFQCPFCSRGAQTIENIEANEEFSGSIRYIFMNLPLPFHQYARGAALAAMAADAQGKFWEYHDALFSSDEPLTEATLTEIATRLELDLEKFHADRASAENAVALNAELEIVESLGINGTPTFMINGNKLVGAQPASEFYPLIRAELANH